MSALYSALGWHTLPAKEHSRAILLRHAERPPIPPIEIGDDLPLADHGHRQSISLGEELAGAVRSLSTSPVRRCVETAEAIKYGAGADLPITPDRMLGDPGAFTADPELAWETWCRWGLQRMYSALIEGSSAPPGMADPQVAARRLAWHMVDSTRNEPGLHHFVTHDLLIATLSARTLGMSFVETPWPKFLTGLVLWADDEMIRLEYLGHEGMIQRQR